MKLDVGFKVLTYWGWDKVAAISQTTLSNAFSWMKISVFWFKLIWSLFRPDDKPLSEPMVVRSLKHICVTRASMSLSNVLFFEILNIIVIKWKVRYRQYHCSIPYENFSYCSWNYIYSNPFQGRLFPLPPSITWIFYCLYIYTAIHFKEDIFHCLHPLHGYFTACCLLVCNIWYDYMALLFPIIAHCD